VTVVTFYFIAYFVSVHMSVFCVIVLIQPLAAKTLCYVTFLYSFVVESIMRCCAVRFTSWLRCVGTCVCLTGWKIAWTRRPKRVWQTA